MPQYRFFPAKPGHHMRVAADGTAFDRAGVVVRHGDLVEIAPAFVDTVRTAYGPDCLIEAGKVVLDGAHVRGLDAAKADGEMWRLRALALAASPAQALAAAVVLGAPKNAAPHVVRETLVNAQPEDVGAAIAGLAALALVPVRAAADDDQREAIAAALRERDEAVAALAEARDALATAAHDSEAAASGAGRLAGEWEAVERGAAIAMTILGAIARAGFEAHARRAQLGKALGWAGEGDVKAYLLRLAANIDDSEADVTADMAAAAADVVAGWPEPEAP